jgi:hypothetical protein
MTAQGEQTKEIPMSKMPIADLKSMLASEKANALAAISAARLMEERADAMDYYLGDMAKDMPAQDGRSRAVSTDVADTIEGLMPSLMDIFAGSDEVVRFEPVGPEDEAAAQQETDYVNHVFMQQNPGFMILYSFIKDALLSKVGIVKVWWEEREEELRADFQHLRRWRRSVEQAQSYTFKAVHHCDRHRFRRSSVARRQGHARKMIRACLVAAALLWSVPAQAFPCWMVRRAVAQYGASAVESWAKANGISEREIEKARRCLR